MKSREINRLCEKVVRKVMKYWGKHDHTQRQHFSAGLDIIAIQIAKHCKIPVDEVGQHTSAVVNAFPNEYQKLPSDMKGPEAMVSMIYSLYMKHLGRL